MSKHQASDIFFMLDYWGYRVFNAQSIKLLIIIFTSKSLTNVCYPHLEKRLSTWWEVWPVVILYFRILLRGEDTKAKERRKNDDDDDDDKVLQKNQSLLIPHASHNNKVKAIGIFQCFCTIFLLFLMYPSTISFQIKHRDLRLKVGIIQFTPLTF